MFDRCKAREKSGSKDGYYDRPNLPILSLKGVSSFGESSSSVVAAGVGTGVSSTGSAFFASASFSAATDGPSVIVMSSSSTDSRDETLCRRTRLKGCLNMRYCAYARSGL